MSSTNKTANLNLHSWVRTDPVVCEDINDNFNKIDEVVGDINASRGNCVIYAGSYTGTGAKVHSLTFPRLPLVLFIQQAMSSSQFYGGFLVDGGTFIGPNSTSGHSNKLAISNTTVTFTEAGDNANNMSFNTNSKIFRYIALLPMQ